MRTAIIASRVFDGSRNLGETTVVIGDGVIEAIGDPVPHDAEMVDAQGATLLPGLIDAHVHTDTAGLRMALQFGVTTELEMQGANTARDRSHITEDDGDGRRPLGRFRAHPARRTPRGAVSQGLQPASRWRHRRKAGRRTRDRVDPIVRAKVTTPAEAVDVVGQLSRAGSDYIKFMVDDGTVEGHPGLPMLDQATLNAGVAEAHRLGMLTVAHALTHRRHTDEHRRRDRRPGSPVHGPTPHARDHRGDRRSRERSSWPASSSTPP